MRFLGMRVVRRASSRTRRSRPPAARAGSAPAGARVDEVHHHALVAHGARAAARARLGGHAERGGELLERRRAAPAAARRARPPRACRGSRGSPASPPTPRGSSRLGQRHRPGLEAARRARGTRRLRWPRCPMADSPHRRCASREAIMPDAAPAPGRAPVEAAPMVASKDVLVALGSDLAVGRVAARVRRGREQQRTPCPS